LHSTLDRMHQSVISQLQYNSAAWRSIKPSSSVSQQTSTGRSTKKTRAVATSADRCRQLRQVPVITWPRRKHKHQPSLAGTWDVSPEPKSTPCLGSMASAPYFNHAGQLERLPHDQYSPTSFFTFACFHAGKLANSSRFMPTTSYTDTTKVTLKKLRIMYVTIGYFTAETY